MKIAIVNAPSPYLSSNKNYYIYREEGCYYVSKRRINPCGALQLATVFKKLGYDVKFLDANSERIDHNKTLLWINEGNFDKVIVIRSPLDKIKLKTLSIIYLSYLTTDWIGLLTGKYNTLPPAALDLLNPKIYQVAQVQVARGCPYRCIFCLYRQTKVVYKPIDIVIKEIQFWRKIVRRYIYFFAPELSIDREYVEELCSKLIKLNLGIKWWANARIGHVDYELSILMKKAGCIKLAFGCESGVDEILAINKKGITTEDIIKQREILKKAGIWFAAYFIIGLRRRNRRTVKFKFIVKFILKYRLSHLNLY